MNISPVSKTPLPKTANCRPKMSVQSCAAEALGVADPYAVLPRYYGFYLERRAKVLER